MGHLYDTREKAIPHPAKTGESLNGLALRYQKEAGVPADLDWKEIARFNWSTDDEKAVTRALAERVGLADPEAVRTGAAPADLRFHTDFRPSPAKPILIPKLWVAAGLELNKKHTIEVRRRLPASAIGIKSLDRWFIPVEETCDFEYATHGEEACANDVTFEVWASNYAKMDSWDDGLPAFSALPDVPVYRDGGKAAGEVKITDWDGTSNCSSGALSPSGHSLNVAFSPYTVLLRYAKKGSHGDARIDLDPFWVLFDKSGKPVLDSCKIVWKLKNADALKVGLIQICDSDGKVIYAKGLSDTELTKGSLDWNGLDATGAEVAPEKMPYRVRLEAHTDIDVEEALAIAAMQTEVRLYVHKDTHTLDRKDYDYKTDQTSLDFSIADVYHKDKEPERKDGIVWTKYLLAKAGFHPGPVNDKPAPIVEPNAFSIALHEFQRSVPKHGGGPGTYERMPIGPENKDTKDALENLDPVRHRPWFGKPLDLADRVVRTKDQWLTWQPSDWPDTAADDFLERLRDPKERMIVWVDDRNWYTDGIYWKFGFYDHRVIVNDRNRALVHGDPADLGGETAAGRGSFEHRDDRVDKDERDVARPWIPLQVDFRLLSKKNHLGDEIAAEKDQSKAGKIRKAIGPLRVDWTFDEIETAAAATVQGGVVQLPVLDKESETIFSHLGGSSSRTRTALRWTMDQRKKSHARKDVDKTSVYYNAKEDVGGIRPDNAATYFEAALGKEADSLAPWTTASSDRESLYCVVHDGIGPGSDVFANRLGRAGVYLHPSRMAGDGYQVRAQVFFKNADKYTLPNAKSLAARYPKCPQAHTVQFRLWRKTSIRAYIKWGTEDNWNNPQPRPWPNFPPPGPLGFRSYYTACHVHISNELNAVNVNHPISTVFTQQAFANLVNSALEPTDPQYVNRGAIHFSQTRCWPWSNHPTLGFPPSAPNEALNAAYSRMSDQGLMLHVRLAFRSSLEMVKSIEKETGRMRGHVLVEYQTTDPPFFLTYRCTTCGATFLYLQAASPTLVLNCTAVGCGGVLTYGGRRIPVSTPRADKTIQGLGSPACGFPAGVFWNFLGVSELWAHELGHNRHFEHAADAFGLGDRRDYHDKTANNAFVGANEKPENKGWDRSCLMSYIPKVKDPANSASTYHQTNDTPCLCFKCVLRNRGWRLVPVANPPSDVTD